MRDRGSERYLVIRDCWHHRRKQFNPVTREITIAGARLSAADTFGALYRLQALRKVSERAFAGIDALVLPTAPTVYSTAQVLANPVELNSRLGTIPISSTCSISAASPCRRDTADDIPFGITLLAPAGQDAHLASIGRVFHADTKLNMGRQKFAAAASRGLAAGLGQRRNRHRGGRRASLRHGAQLRIEGARRSPAGGRNNGAGLQALCASHHAAKPGMLRVEKGAGSVDRAGALGAVGGSVRKIRRRDPAAAVDRDGASGGWPQVKGFIVEPADVDGARDISAFGGWRAFVIGEGRGVKGSCPGRGAAFFTMHRRAGTHRYGAWTPDQQRTAYALRSIRGTYLSASDSHRHRVDLVFTTHQLDMRAHRGGGAGLVAAHDRHHDRSCSACDFAKRPRLRNWARRNGCTRHPGSQGHFGDIAVLRAA